MSGLSALGVGELEIETIGDVKIIRKDEGSLSDDPTKPGRPDIRLDLLRGHDPCVRFLDIVKRENTRRF